MLFLKRAVGSIILDWVVQENNNGPYFILSI